MAISQAIIYYIPVEKTLRKFKYAFSNDHYLLAIFYAFEWKLLEQIHPTNIDFIFLSQT